MSTSDESNDYHVFLSYSHSDREWANALAQALSRQKVRVWTDSQIRPGERWADSIDTALTNSKYVVFLVSPKSNRSSWAAFELGAALGMGKPVLPVVSADVSDEELAGPIRSRKFIRESDTETLAAQLASVVLSKDGSYGSNGA